MCVCVSVLWHVLGQRCCLEVFGLSGDLIISSLLPLERDFVCAGQLLSACVPVCVRVCNNLVLLVI